MSEEAKEKGGEPPAPEAPQPAKPAAPAAPAAKPRPVKAPPPPRPEPQVMGPALGRLVRKRLGREKIDSAELEEIRQAALALQRQVVEVMGKEEFTVAEAEKKDIIWRQRYDRARAVLDELARTPGTSRSK